MKKLFTLMMLLFCITIIAQDKIYVHTATADNSAFNYTVIDHPDLNGNPDAGIVSVHVWNPNEALGVYNNNVTGLWYDGSNWAIFNENTSVDMVEGSSYNVYIADPDDVIIHVSTAANQGSFGDFATVIDNPLLNGVNPGPHAIISNYWNPNSVYNNLNYGFYYDAGLGRRAIYQESTISIPVGSAFKILIDGSGLGIERFTHVVTAENNITNWSVIDHPSLNNNENATFVFTHFWGVEGATTQVDLDKVLGVWYDGANWSIYREDETDQIPLGMAFDIIVAPQTTVGVEEIMLEANVSVHPNPTSDFVTISTKDAISNVTVYNNLGREILQVEGGGNIVKLDLSDLSLGVYLAKVRVGNAVKTVKLIKQ